MNGCCQVNPLDGIRSAMARREASEPSVKSPAGKAMIELADAMFRIAELRSVHANLLNILTLRSKNWGFAVFL